MARCCGGGSCSCKVQGGANVTVTGIGSSTDPFVIAADMALAVVDNSVFDMNMTGSGTTASPWGLSVAYSPTAKLDDVPDVNASAPSNAQVLGWDSATSKWTPRAPTTAASGSVTHDTSLAGDGSGGSPLQVLEDPARGLSTTGAGLGLTDPFQNQMVRRFSDAMARSTASPAPVLNSMSTLDSLPGQIDYWTGSAWLPVKSPVTIDATGNQLLNISGAYSGQNLVMMVRSFAGTTDSSGNLTVLTTANLSGKAGILSATVSVFGSQAYMPILSPGGNYLAITARRLDDGALLTTQAIQGQVTAYLY